MIPAWLTWPAAFGAVADHLWQSTLFLGLAALLTLAFRRNRAQVRYWIWLAASVKFLIPFAALTALGRAAGREPAMPGAPSDVSLLIEAMGQPFSGPALTASTSFPSAGGIDPGVRLALIGAIWIAGCVAVAVAWSLNWRRVSAALRAAAPLETGSVRAALDRFGLKGRSLAIRESRTTLEPGVFGIRRPVLLWPRGIDAHLDDPQVEAILAHELAHVRRRDNLTAAVHVVAEAAFWFHPLVWWIGARLVDERERACDEEVLRRGIEPHVYAQSILKACQFYVEAPPACVAGVTGSDLKKRMETIMRDEGLVMLSAAKRMLLSLALFLTVAGPVAIGVLTTPHLAAQSTAPAQASSETSDFEAASVKPNTSGDSPIQVGVQPGGRFSASNVPLRMLIRLAYNLQDYQIVGGPDWLASDHFDVAAKAPEGEFTFATMRPILRSLLEERFTLVIHNETRQMPIYALVKARGDGSTGPSLSASTVDCAEIDLQRGRRGGGPPPVPIQAGQPIDCGFIIGPGRMSVGGMPISNLAMALSPMVGRIVMDRTGLAGTYSYELTYSPEQLGGRPPQPLNAAPPAIDPNMPSIFTALQEQLGLKLESDRGPVEVLVIDSVAQPTEN
jgi:uncharacterized protein (TIGR03435 family)